MTRSPISFSRMARTLFVSVLCLFGVSALASCGGGPTVASSTGTVLYVGTGNGVYAFSLQSNNVLKPVSTSPIAPGNVYSLQYVQTPGGSANPTLYVATGGSSIATYSVTGSGALSSTPGTLATTSSCLVHYYGLAATSDGNWLVAVDGSASSTNIAAINLTTRACTTGSTGSGSTTYPISVAVDCLVGPSSCDTLVTLSTSAFPTIAPTNPEYLTGWNTTTTTSFPGTPTTLSNSLTSRYTAFSPTTTYFYLSSTTNSSGQIGSLLGYPPPSTTSTYNSTNASFPSTITSPCVDQKNNQFYIPTANASIYQISINASGGLGAPARIWNSTASANLVPQTPYMYACTVQN